MKNPGTVSSAHVLVRSKPRRKSSFSRTFGGAAADTAGTTSAAAAASTAGRGRNLNQLDIGKPPICGRPPRRGDPTRLARRLQRRTIWPRVESNHRTQLRRLPLYPLSYGASTGD